MEGDAVSLLFPFYQEWRDNHESRRNLLNETTILLEESREFCKTLHTIVFFFTIRAGPFSTAKQFAWDSYLKLISEL